MPSAKGHPRERHRGTAFPPCGIVASFARHVLRAVCALPECGASGAHERSRSAGAHFQTYALPRVFGRKRSAWPSTEGGVPHVRGEWAGRPSAVRRCFGRLAAPSRRRHASHEIVPHAMTAPQRLWDV